MSLQSVAEEVNIATTYLSHLFKKEMQLTFSDYLTMIRIVAAKRMLYENRRKIHEIAIDVGFSDNRYFSRVFKDVYKRQGIYCLLEEVLQDVRAGKGPVLIEMDTYRVTGHYFGDNQNYRTKEEVNAWKDKDPILRCKKDVYKRQRDCFAEIHG